MKRFIDGVDRSQTTLFPDRLEDGIDDDNPVRMIDVCVVELGPEQAIDAPGGFSRLDSRTYGAARVEILRYERG